MSSGKQRFTERELRRALRAAEKEGVPMQRVEIDREGKIILIPVTPARENPKQEANEWDSVA